MPDLHEAWELLRHPFFSGLKVPESVSSHCEGEWVCQKSHPELKCNNDKITCIPSLERLLYRRPATSLGTAYQPQFLSRSLWSYR